MPGGRDQPYCRELGGAGAGAVRDWVERGGGYLGLCAGAYWACSRVKGRYSNIYNHGVMSYVVCYHIS